MAAATLALAVAGCGGGGGSPATAATKGGKADASIYTGASPGGTAVAGGTLEVSRSQAPITLDPVAAADGGSLYVVNQMFDELVEYMPGKAEPQPALAERWTVSKDGLRYDFKLRSGVRFSDGTPVTAKDVRYSLLRVDSAENIANTFIAQTFKRVSVIGADTVRVELTKRTDALLDWLGLATAAIVPEHVVRDVGEKAFAKHPVGSGAFALASWNAGKDLTLRRNPNYWRKGQPYLDGVKITFTSEASTRVLAVQSGGADVADSVPFSQIAPLRGDQRARLLVRPLSTFLAVLFNHRDPHFSDVTVRHALALATPRSQIVKSVLAGAGTPATGVLPQLKYWDKSVKGWPYDPGEAQKLMAAGPFKSGFEVTLLMQVGDPVVKAIGEILQQAWLPLGVKLKIRQVDSTTMVNEYVGGKYQLALFPAETLGASSPSDDESAQQIQDYSSGSKSIFTFYNSKEATKLVHQAAEATSEQARRQTFSALQQLGVRDVQLDAIAYVPSRTLISKRVRGFDMMFDNSSRLERVWLAK